MSVPYVCLRCRQRANRILFPLKSRSFISLSSSSPKPDDTNSAVLSANKQKKERIAKAQDEKHESKSVDSSTVPVWGKPLESVNSMLERLFQSTQRARPDLPVRSRYSQTLNPTYVPVDHSPSNILKNDLATIQGMLDKDVPTKKVLDTMTRLPSFKNQAGHGTRTADEVALLKHNDTLRNFLFKVLKERVSLLGNEGKAKPAELAQTYIACDVMVEQWWYMIQLKLLAEVTKSRTSSGEGEVWSLVSDSRFRRSLCLLSDVIQVWKIFAKVFGAAPVKLSRNAGKTAHNAAAMHDHAAVAQNWEGLLSPEALDHVNCGPRPGFSIQLLYCFPKITAIPNTTALAAAAAVTYISLRAALQSSIISDSLSVESKPFMDLMTRIISSTSSDDQAVLDSLSLGLKRRGVVPAIADRLCDEWRSIRREAQDRQQANGSKKRKGAVSKRARGTINRVAAGKETALLYDDNEHFMVTEEISINTVPTGPKIQSTSSLLRRAAKEWDVKLALKLWKREMEQMSTRTSSYSSVFVEFLRTFFAVGRPDYATEVWNTMCKHGYKPTTMHWVTLLEGCKKTQDLVSLKSIWRRMEVAEMQNTNQAWTVYISGLLHCKDWQSALNAVDDLEKAWKLSKDHLASKGTNAQGTIHEADQFSPSMVPINAAISGLLGNRKPNLAQQILSWAISKNIKPDTTTFNILLRPAVRHDDSEQVQKILSEMKHHACDPDVVTFTIIIDGIFRNPSSAFEVQSPEAQQALIVRIFKDMQDHNIKATIQTYSTILDGLLHPKYFNLPAARATLARMTDQGIKPTPHIYTILVTHYFSLTPPDLPAIDGLCRRIELEKSPVDHIFYDRMIEGYGRVGAIDKMLAVLRRMPLEGKRPGWIALLGALKALAQAEEWDLVKDLVRDVTDEKEGLLRFGSRGWKGKEEFWDFVDALRERGLEMPGRGGFVEMEEAGQEAY
ncbi:hypothetical protein MMC26_005208 [Xylographa opegraphella]|nr:hypothetical protein [Xylographa opegraphella]